MSAEIVTPQLDVAARAGDKTVEQDTFIPLVDMNPLTCAEFLSVRSWKERAAYFASIITDSVNRAAQMHEVLELEKQDPTLLPEPFAGASTL
jgi:hypothetical protein